MTQARKSKVNKDLLSRWMELVEKHHLWGDIAADSPGWNQFRVRAFRSAERAYEALPRVGRKVFRLAVTAGLTAVARIEREGGWAVDIVRSGLSADELLRAVRTTGRMVPEATLMSTEEYERFSRSLVLDALIWLEQAPPGKPVPSFVTRVLKNHGSYVLHDWHTKGA